MPTQQGRCVGGGPMHRADCVVMTTGKKTKNNQTAAREIYRRRSICCVDSYNCYYGKIGSELNSERKREESWRSLDGSWLF